MRASGKPKKNIFLSVADLLQIKDTTMAPDVFLREHIARLNFEKLSSVDKTQILDFVRNKFPSLFDRVSWMLDPIFRESTIVEDPIFPDFSDLFGVAIDPSKAVQPSSNRAALYPTHSFVTTILNLQNRAQDQKAAPQTNEQKEKMDEPVLYDEELVDHILELKTYLDIKKFATSSNKQNALAYLKSLSRTDRAIYLRDIIEKPESKLSRFFATDRIISSDDTLPSTFKEVQLLYSQDRLGDPKKFESDTLFYRKIISTWYEERKLPEVKQLGVLSHGEDEEFKSASAVSLR